MISSPESFDPSGQEDTHENAQPSLPILVIQSLERMLASTEYDHLDDNINPKGRRTRDRVSRRRNNNKHK